MPPFFFQNLPQTSVVLEDVVLAQSIQSPGRAAGVGTQRSIVEQCANVLGDVQRRPERILELVGGEVAAVVWEILVISQGVEHGAGTTSCNKKTSVDLSR
jgi:hypothetical protein